MIIISKIELEGTDNLKYTDVGYTEDVNVANQINEDYDSTLGAFLGANNTSVILLTLLLVGFLVFMKLSGPAEEKKEGLLFAGGPILIIAWILGFMIKGLVLN